MSYRFHGKASVDPNRPRAWATCDRCGDNYNLFQLDWDRQWAGVVLVNTRFLVCPRCRDVPQEQFRTIVLPADPPPVLNARIEPYAIDETNFFCTQTPEPYITEAGDRLVTESG